MRVELDHLGSLLVGMWIEILARVVALAGPHIETAVAVCDALGPVGRAHHTRFVIDRLLNALPRDGPRSPPPSEALL